MSSSTLQRCVAGAAFAAALAFVNGSANAVIYSSVFDPPNFRGVATFDVSEGCLSVGTGYAFNGSGNCTVRWLSATVTFTDDPDFEFNYSSVLPDLDIVNFIWVEEGELAGVNSDLLGAVEISGAPNGAYNGPWWVQYSFPPPSSDLAGTLDGPPSIGDGLGVVYLYGGACFNTGSARPCVPNREEWSTAIVEDFTRVTQVPEPGTLILALAGLMGAGLARRRFNA